MTKMNISIIINTNPIRQHYMLKFDENIFKTVFFYFTNVFIDLEKTQ